MLSPSTPQRKASEFSADAAERLSIDQVDVSAYKIPTATPESDGTAQWNATTLVMVAIHAGKYRGMGYSYASRAAAVLVHDKLRELLIGEDALAVELRYCDMLREVRNDGRDGIAATAISAVDNALWDLKAKYFDVALATLLGRARDAIRIYGSGGFTSYSEEQLQTQFSEWAQNGSSAFKMKVGREPQLDPARVRSARRAIGDAAELFVDANGAYTPKQALLLAETFAQSSVTWFEEPVSSDDLSGLKLLRDRAPAVMQIAAGEYGYDLQYFRRMLEAQAVDVLQVDATRCCGVTGFMRAAALCDAFMTPLSSHCAPALHLHVMCAAPRAIHMEYFFDHVRIESMLFDGVTSPSAGCLSPDWQRPGLGLEFKAEDAACYRQ